MVRGIIIESGPSIRLGGQAQGPQARQAQGPQARQAEGPLYSKMLKNRCGP